MPRRENWLTERSGISKTVMVKYQNINYKLQISIVTLINKKLFIYRYLNNPL